MNTWQQLVKEFIELKQRVAKLEQKSYYEKFNPQPPMAVAEDPVKEVLKRGRPRKSEVPT